MNKNSQRFADLHVCSLNQHISHKRIHKTTWWSPDHVTENQIDHIFINRKFLRAWKDVRVMRLADISSDHHLLKTAVRLHLKKFNNTANRRTRYNVSVLKQRNSLQPVQQILPLQDH